MKATNQKYNEHFLGVKSVNRVGVIRLRKWGNRIRQGTNIFGACVELFMYLLVFIMLKSNHYTTLYMY